MALRKLDLGCGPNKRDGFIGIDMFPFPGVDYVRDLARGLPFDDNSVDEIHCQHVLEHFDGEDLIYIVEEMWRVLKPLCPAVVIVPDITSANRFKDPTHKTRDWSPESFDFWKCDQRGKHIIYRGPLYRCRGKFSVASGLRDEDRVYTLVAEWK